MKRHAKRRRAKVVKRRRHDQEPFHLSIPVTWDRVTTAAAEQTERLHAVSWRKKLVAALGRPFSNPRWISLMLLGLIGATFYLLGVENVFHITEVDVSGTVTLAPQRVMAASEMSGQHIFWVDPARTVRQVAEIPNVLTATVEISWPNQARVVIGERAPVMVWDQAGERFWVDREGRVMEARQESTGKLMILSQESEEMNPGDQIPFKVMAGAMQLRELRPNIESLYYDHSDGLSYLDGRNWTAHFGVGTDMNQKLVIYEALVDDLMARDLQPDTISVVNKEKPFYRLIN